MGFGGVEGWAGERVQCERSVGGKPSCRGVGLDSLLCYVGDRESGPLPDDPTSGIPNVKKGYPRGVEEGELDGD